MDILMWLTEFGHSAMLGFVHWVGASLPLVQIYSDTGYWWSRQENMPAIQQNIHDRLTAWILKDSKKKEN